MTKTTKALAALFVLGGLLAGCGVKGPLERQAPPQEQPVEEDAS